MLTVGSLMMEKRKRKGADEGVGILDTIFKVSRRQCRTRIFRRMISRDVSKESRVRLNDWTTIGPCEGFRRWQGHHDVATPNPTHSGITELCAIATPLTLHRSRSAFEKRQEPSDEFGVTLGLCPR